MICVSNYLRNKRSYYIFYTDNEPWIEDISQKRVMLTDDNRITSMLFHHICSKICMFQFLQMSHELIEGLVDCFDDNVIQ